MKAYSSSLLPYPLRSLALLCTWLLLNQSLHPAQWALGAVFAVSLPLAFSRLWPRITIVRNARRRRRSASAFSRLMRWISAAN